MTTATIQKIKREVKKELMAEFIIPLLEQTKDSEGEYRPQFIKEILKTAKERALYRYNSKSFLKLIS